MVYYLYHPNRHDQVITVEGAEVVGHAEDGAGAALTGNRGFLPEVRGNPCDAHGFRHPAETMPNLRCAEGMAGPRAECACVHCCASPRMIMDPFREASEGCSVRSVPSR